MEQCFEKQNRSKFILQRLLVKNYKSREKNQSNFTTKPTLEKTLENESWTIPILKNLDPNEQLKIRIKEAKNYYKSRNLSKSKIQIETPLQKNLQIFSSLKIQEQKKFQHKLRNFSNIKNLKKNNDKNKGKYIMKILQQYKNQKIGLKKYLKNSENGQTFSLEKYEEKPLYCLFKSRKQPIELKMNKIFSKTVQRKIEFNILRNQKKAKDFLNKSRIEAEKLSKDHDDYIQNIRDKWDRHDQFFYETLINEKDPNAFKKDLKYKCFSKISDLCKEDLERSISNMTRSYTKFSSQIKENKTASLPRSPLNRSILSKISHSNIGIKSSKCSFSIEKNHIESPEFHIKAIEILADPIEKAQNKLEELNNLKKNLINNKINEETSDFLQKIKLNDLKSVELILLENPDLINSQDNVKNKIELKNIIKNHFTCLHWAAKRGLSEMIDLLIRHNANLSAIDIMKRTALDVLIQYNHLHLISKLKNHNKMFGKNKSIEKKLKILINSVAYKNLI